MSGKGLFTLVTGGVRCGKSSFAEKLAFSRGGEQVVYVATCFPQDDEMRLRVEAHRQQRPAVWKTVEETTNVAAVISEYGQKVKVVLVDCLTVLLSNYLTGAVEEGYRSDNILSHCKAKAKAEAWQEVEAITKAALTVSASVIIVSNEVGWGLVPSSPLGRQYRDLLGKANAYIANSSNEVYLLVAGLPLELKSLTELNTWTQDK